MSAVRLAVTVGDPAGVGPEIVAQVLADAALWCDVEPVPVGPAAALPQCPGRSVEAVHLPGTALPVPGQGCALSGQWALATLQAAARLAEAGEVDGIVTAPVSKAAIQQAGDATFIGHTEFFGARVGVAEPTMFFWSPTLCVSLVTIHCALRDVPARLTSARVRITIERTREALRVLGCDRPRIGVCGLNPHAGEGGLFGEEDAEIIAPVVEQQRECRGTIDGPLPADTAFMRAGRGDFDALVAMYHDQGLGPFKLVAFDTGVNVTLGLPYVRTSVDHGTAFDIAGRGIADASSMKAAVQLAARLVRGAAVPR